MYLNYFQLIDEVGEYCFKLKPGFFYSFLKTYWWNEIILMQFHWAFKDFCWGWRLCFKKNLCYHERHVQQIHTFGTTSEFMITIWNQKLPNVGTPCICFSLSENWKSLVGFIMFKLSIKFDPFVSYPLVSMNHWTTHMSDFVINFHFCIKVEPKQCSTFCRLNR